MAIQARRDRPKVIRTQLYGDFQVSEWELRLLHTPLMQRLYDLKQLGFADRVYPDAIHSRLNHVLGVMQVTERILDSLQQSVENRDTRRGARGLPQVATADVSIPDIASSADALRLVALLHDVTHIPFGHTLEDEVGVFAGRHEDHPRQIDYLNRLTLEFLSGVYSGVSAASLWATVAPQPSAETNAIAPLFRQLTRMEGRGDTPILRGFSQFMDSLREACVILLGMHLVDRDPLPTEPVPVAADLILNGLYPTPRVFDVRRDAWKADVIGNTICADLLDYARRDVHYAGLVSAFDDRIYRYLELQKVRDAIRVVIRVFTSKIRLDVLSEILNILKVRYLLSERVLFHPTKCAAGAMLGRAAVLLGKTDSDMTYCEWGDRELLVAWRDEAKLRAAAVGALRDFMLTPTIATLRGVRNALNHPALRGWQDRVVAEWDRRAPQQIRGRSTQGRLRLSAETAEGREILFARLRRFRRRPGVMAVLQGIIDAEGLRANGAVRLLSALLARQYYKPVYQITRQAAEAHRLTSENIAATFSVPAARDRLEHELEEKLVFPPGTIILYCPKERTTLKEARVLVSWSQTEEPRPFNQLDLPGFRSFLDESRSIEEKYRDIWSMYVFVPEALLPMFKLIQGTIQERLGVQNSQLLQASLLEDPRAARLSADIQSVDKTHVKALVNTVKRMSDTFATAARYDFPDFVEAYREELKTLLSQGTDESTS